MCLKVVGQPLLLCHHDRQNQTPVFNMRGERMKGRRGEQIAVFLRLIPLLPRLTVFREGIGNT
jgi:hypothetical protein